MTEIVGYGTWAVLSHILGQLPHASAYALLEQTPTAWIDEPERQQLLRFERWTDELDIEPYDMGRIFTGEYELRWDHAADAVVYIGRDRELSGLTLKSLDSCQVRDRSYSMWGALVADPEIVGETSGSVVYVALRIPRLLRYPVDSRAQRLRLCVREYLDPVTAAIVASRFRSIEEDA